MRGITVLKSLVVGIITVVAILIGRFFFEPSMVIINNSIESSVSAVRTEFIRTIIPLIFSFLGSFISSLVLFGIGDKKI